jgi:hypothetical protein
MATDIKHSNLNIFQEKCELEWLADNLVSPLIFGLVETRIRLLQQCFN